MITDILLALSGGVLIGLAATLMLLLFGRVTGISGIFWHSASTLTSPDKNTAINTLFIVGLVLGTVITHALSGLPTPSLVMDNKIMAITAGLLVGFGTRLGSGCTSGHGICGLARLSKRSLVATACFMAFGLISASITHLLFEL